MAQFNEANSVRDFVRDLIDSVDVQFVPGSALSRATSGVLLEVQVKDALVRLNPEIRVDPSWLEWNNGAVRTLAQAAYDEREMPSSHLDRRRLAVLADTLEEAGCSDPDILGHLRGPGPCVRGCHVIDLLLRGA